MSRDSSAQPDSFTTPESAFKILSHDLRLDILLALWEAPGFSLSFSDLRRAVDERDSGSFSYHLSQLEGHFVAQTDDGYELQYPGHRVLDAIQSGVFHERTTLNPIPLSEECYRCGDEVMFTYDTEYIARITCPSCENRLLEWPFDPGGIAGRDPGEIVGAFDRRTRLFWSCAVDGICPFCTGRIHRSFASHVHEEGTCIGVIEQLDRYDEYFARDHPALLSMDCEQCSFYSVLPTGVVLLTRPAILGDLTEAGHDVRATPLWGLGFIVDPAAITLESAEPMEVAVSVEAGDTSTRYLIDSTFEPTRAPAEDS